ncbi:hypothetical protein LOTGIDRAFT_162246 [Lottia gigantea]|uniref:Homeobox domain-containing protein n=1 Tax=Lottia gigantea TaxID=225164 RepID=V4ACD2_LOTGI|nr:hypothetical protein LOTGIDRAFT_162246 [Lottia gigantea]ESO92765.1 hypothetical protein LOTGIDRAFT_162246 [Lottia gigantea]
MAAVFPNVSSLPAGNYEVLRFGPQSSEDATRTGFPISLFSSVSNVTDVKVKEKALLESFDSLRPLYPEPIMQLSCSYKYYSASIEMERLNSIQGELKDFHNQNFDSQLNKIIDRVEYSLKLLSSRDRPSPSITRTRPVLTRNSLKVLEEWYECHLDHPYPTASQVEWLAQVSSLNTEQVKKWFGNKRSRSKNTRSLTEIAKVKRRQRLLKRH